MTAPDDYLETLRQAIGRVRAAPIEVHRHVVYVDELARARRGEQTVMYCADCLAPVVIDAQETAPGS